MLHHVCMPLAAIIECICWHQRCSRSHANGLQGFCCSCSSGQVWQESIGSAQERTRAGLNCDYFENPYLPVFGKPPGSAHCLQYQSAWCGQSFVEKASAAHHMRLRFGRAGSDKMHGPSSFATT